MALDTQMQTLKMKHKRWYEEVAPLALRVRIGNPMKSLQRRESFDILLRPNHFRMCRSHQ